MKPPNAPPISAPLVGIFTFTIPQSEPFGPTHLNRLPMFWVKRLLDKPWSTSLFHRIASSRLCDYKLLVIN
jgi:hypothetical protein